MEWKLLVVPKFYSCGQKADLKTFRTDIYTPNKFRTDPEVFASKVDPSAAKKIHDFSQSFHFEGPYQKSGR